MAEYAFMKSLEVWYEKIDVKRLVNSIMIDEDERARMAKGSRRRAHAVLPKRLPKTCRACRIDAAHQDNRPHLPSAKA
jgi:hypothetical protein